MEPAKTYRPSPELAWEEYGAEPGVRWAHADDFEQWLQVRRVYPPHSGAEPAWYIRSLRTDAPSSWERVTVVGGSKNE